MPVLVQTYKERVSWYDAVYFCNKLSEECGYTPVYSVNGSTDVTKWGYTPHERKEIRGKVTWNTKANGFRLPTEEEWEFAARGGKSYEYSGSNNLDEVGWYNRNSGRTTHPVAQKKANGYGLYDMSGNVWEWCYDASGFGCRLECGGSVFNGSCSVSSRWKDRYPKDYDDDLGFRLARTVGK